MADPYTYPGSTVLINLRGIRDAAMLRRFEHAAATLQLTQALPDVPMSYEGFKALHRHLFGSVYAWAGEPRSVNLSKGEIIFAPPGRIDPLMARQFTMLGHERFLTDLPPARFAARAAVHLCEMHAIHPFREGNGRTLLAFYKVLAQQAGHTTDLSQADPAAWNHGRNAGFWGDYRQMAEVIGTTLVPAGQGREVGRTGASPVSEAFRERSRKAAAELDPAIRAPHRPSPGYDID